MIERLHVHVGLAVHTFGFPPPGSGGMKARLNPGLHQTDLWKTRTSVQLEMS